MDVSYTTEGWIGLAEAAEQLGISLDAMRRRVRRGEYQRRQVRTRHGPAWQVNIKPGAHGEPTVAPSDEPTVTPTVETVVTVDATVSEFVSYLRERDQIRDQEIEQLRCDAQAKAEAAAMWQARAEFLSEQLERAQLALAAPRETDSPEIAPQRDSEDADGEPVQASSESAQARPWWCFWR